MQATHFWRMATHCGNTWVTCWHGWTEFRPLFGPRSWWFSSSSWAFPCRHKAALDVEVDWIGWRISVLTWSISIPEENLSKIVQQLHKLTDCTKVPLKDMQSLVGRLLWLTSGWHFLRPVFRCTGHYTTSPLLLVGMDHVTFQQLLDALSPQLTLTTDLTHRHQSLCQQVKLVRVANTHVHTLDDASKLHLKSRRVWIGIQDPTSPSRSIDDEAREASRLWAKLLVSTPFSHTGTGQQALALGWDGYAKASKAHRCMGTFGTQFALNLGCLVAVAQSRVNREQTTVQPMQLQPKVCR